MIRKPILREKLGEHGDEYDHIAATANRAGPDTTLGQALMAAKSEGASEETLRQIVAEHIAMNEPGQWEELIRETRSATKGASRIA